MIRGIAVLAVATTLIGAAPATMGGWAVITVKDLPERLVVGRATEITFTMLQHGERPLTGRSPKVYLKGENQSLLASFRRPAAREISAGVYTASVTPSATGTAEIVIDGDWHSAKVTLLPIRVGGAGARPIALTQLDRGRQLFVAKGCISCHRRTDDPETARTQFVASGPELTGRHFPAEWLSRKLADPARDRVQYSEWVKMPDLELKPAEIAALVEYLNGGRAAAAQR